jgi:4-hydroxy-2-oxoheptanedioate aldolase
MPVRFLLSVLMSAIPCGLVPAAAPAQPKPPAHLNRTIELLEQGKAVFGVFSKDRSLDNARELARSELDFILIDMEHGPFDTETLRSFLLGMTDKRAILDKGSLQPSVTPIGRVPSNGREQLQFLAKQVLDVGAFGVMYPYVSTRDEALNAVRATRYPQRKGAPDMEPVGLRGNAPGNAVWYWGVTDYIDRADVWPLDPRGDLLAIIQIETPEGVKNVEEILSVPGIGAIFVGPADLSMSLGHPNDLAAPAVESAIQTVLRACRARNIPCGITTGPADVERRIREGFRIVTVGLDAGITPSGAAALARGRAAAGR